MLLNRYFINLLESLLSREQQQPLSFLTLHLIHLRESCRQPKSMWMFFFTLQQLWTIKPLKV